ncbi:MAG: hypothetical protein ACXVCE_10360 [Bacteriovorax sp.]
MIHLYSGPQVDQLSKGDDYLLWVKKRRVYRDVLEVELIKYKKII